MFYNCHAAPALLALIIGCALPSCIMSQCSRTNPAGCTTCATCVGSGVGNAYGRWYSAGNGNNCGGAGISGTCVTDSVSASTLPVPCRDVNGARNYYANDPSDCTSCSAVPSNKVGSCSNAACDQDTMSDCYTNQLCAQFGSGIWFNSDRSNTQVGKSGLCYKSSMPAPCSSWQLRSLGGSSSSSNTNDCSAFRSCQSCLDRSGVFIKSSSDSSSGTCYPNYPTCDKSFYNDGFTGCSSSPCLEEKCRSGGSCTSPTPVPGPAPGPAPGPSPSSSACSSSQGYNCVNCADCTRFGNYWSSSSASNPSTFFSSNTIGQCYSTYSSAPCNSYVFSTCTSTSVSQTYRVCPDNRFDAVFYAAIAIPLVIWFINIIAIAVVARRKGLNPCMYVILAIFFSFLAWFCLCCGSNQTGGQALIGRVGGVQLKTMNVQAYAATPPGGYASNFQAQPSVPDPYSANVLSKPSAANAVSNPYAADAVTNPYAANAVQNPYGQSPAPAPYGNAVPDAYNPYAANSGAATAPPAYNSYAANSGAASAPPAYNPYAAQPAAFDPYSQNVQYQASAENSQNAPAIMPH